MTRRTSGDSPHFIEPRDIPDARYYVLATDAFLSGWGPARDKRNVVVLLADDQATAYTVLGNLLDRDEMKRPRVTTTRPRPARGTVYTLIEGENWYIPGYFRKQLKRLPRRRRRVR